MPLAVYKGMRLIALLLVALTYGCAADVTDSSGWLFAYRLEGIPQNQGCTVARSTDPALVRLEWPTPVSDGNGGFVGWYHPCQDGTDRLCPDISAPGMYADVYTNGSIDPTPYIVIEECR